MARCTMTPCQKEKLSRKRFDSGGSSARHAVAGTGQDRSAGGATEHSDSTAARIFTLIAHHGCSPMDARRRALSSCTHATTARVLGRHTCRLEQWQKTSKTWRGNSAHDQNCSRLTCAQSAHLKSPSAFWLLATGSKVTRQSVKSSAGESSHTWIDLCR